MKRLVIIDGCKDCPYHQKPSSRDKETINSLHYCKKSKLYANKFEILYEYCPLPEHKDELFKTFDGETVERPNGETYIINTDRGDDKKKPKFSLDLNV